MYRHYLPNRVLVGRNDGDDEAFAGTRRALPLLESREKIDGRPTAYVCRDYVCQLPTTEPEGLARQLVE